MNKRFSAGKMTLLASALAATAALSACGNNNSNEAAANNGAAAISGGEQVTLRVFSNLPNRKSGQGLAEQMVIDSYMKANPNVKIELNTLVQAGYVKSSILKNMATPASYGASFAPPVYRSAGSRTIIPGKDSPFLNLIRFFSTDK
ncbi:hypothetical protein [Paenibacillus sp. NFR01]|uniref:hypothetical protein n=1 Tax=Paenibacillus sp. NFR01 TaxID=1566279 RepID=UPI0008D753E6|nr:hypothetical protein [Paenibacillus sp. NFR01]SET91252.1 hypothetical protein SAMN03159358_2664 [Paenibacillus sp. NFR01]